MNTSDWLDALDLAWDGVATGVPVDDAIDPETQRLLTSLHRLQVSADATLAGRRRSWSPPARAKRRVRLHGPRFNAIHAYALVGLLVLASMAGAYSTTRHDDDLFGGATAIPAASVQPLYRIDSSNGIWQQINPTTLEAIPGKSGVVFRPVNPLSSTPGERFVALSRDGSTVWSSEFVLRSGNEDWVSTGFYDVASNRKRSTIPGGPNVTASSSSLSADGSRFVEFRTEQVTTISAANYVVIGMDVYDTMNGVLLRSIDLSSADADVLGMPVVDPNASRAYVITASFADHAAHPGMVTLLTYDLVSGKEIGTIKLDGMMSYEVNIRGTGPKPAHVYMSGPDAAISGDGRSLAVLAWDGNKIAVLDIASNELATRPIKTAQGDSCVPKGGRFWFEMGIAYETGRIVTKVWQINGYGSTWLGYCSINTSTGAAVFLSTRDIVPAGWLATYPFLSSDGKRLYLTGSRLVGVHAYRTTPDTIASPINQTAAQGVFAFDAATLTPLAQWTLQVTPDQNGGTGYQMLTETRPG